MRLASVILAIAFLFAGCEKAAARKALVEYWGPEALVPAKIVFSGAVFGERV